MVVFLQHLILNKEKIKGTETSLGITNQLYNPYLDNFILFC